MRECREVFREIVDDHPGVQPSVERTNAMPIATLVAYLRRRYAAHRRFRHAIAEIRAMSNSQLHEMGAFEIDMIEAARRDLAQA